MDILLKVKSLEIVGASNAAEAIIEFNSQEFKAKIFPKGLHSEDFDLDIPGLDLKNLEKAGFVFDLSEVETKYREALAYSKMHKKKMQRKSRERIYHITRLHELRELLSPYFSMMTLGEFMESNSGALYAFYRFPYRDYCKELSIFMDRDKFVVYDQLNEETVTDYARDANEVKKIIDEHISSWKHKVDFKMALMQHVEENEKDQDPTQTISATEYFKQLQEQDKVHEDEIRENHRKYLKMLGKLGDSREIEDHKDMHSGVEETDSIDKKRILGSLTDTKKIKIRHMFEDK